MAVTTLILVPARSGSKGLPDKNIRLLAGKPLLAWTAEQIYHANLPNSLAILSTDSKEYARLGNELGLATPFMRPADCASDQSSAIAVVHHALNWFEQTYHYYPEQLMYLQPTSPFRAKHCLQQALNVLNDQQVDAVIGCQAIYRDLSSLYRLQQGYLQVVDHKQPIMTARQQIQPLLTPNGALYLCKTRHLLDKASFYPEKTLPLIMNKVNSLDIDTEEDWQIAEAYIKQGLLV